MSSDDEEAPELLDAAMTQMPAHLADAIESAGASVLADAAADRQLLINDAVAAAVAVVRAYFQVAENARAFRAWLLEGGDDDA
jgi:hypothetical protein